jgi:nitroreductase
MKETADQLIRGRCSTYPANFEPGRKIDDNLIREILETAVWAPSHGLTQPWSFVVFRGEGVTGFFSKLRDIYREITPPEEIKQSKITKYDEKGSQVSHVIAVNMIRDPAKKYPEIEEIVATASALENLYICIQAYGIAGFLSTGKVCYTQQIKDFLNLGPEDRCLGFFELGYAREGLKRPLRKRIPASEKTTWVG